MADEKPKILQVVDGEGAFLAEDLEQFATANKFSELKQGYQVVAIMGPQSSGKSTLLNHLVRLSPEPLAQAVTGSK